MHQLAQSPLILGALWIVAATIVATLPMRLQYAPGLALLVAAPVLIAWIGITNGWMPVVFGVFALVSMFRRPLRYLVRRAIRGNGEVA